MALPNAVAVSKDRDVLVVINWICSPSKIDNSTDQYDYKQRDGDDVILHNALCV